VVIGALRHRSAVRAEGEVVVRPSPAAVASVRAQGFLVLLAKFMDQMNEMLWFEDKHKGPKWMELS
jgi:hypothetical protein